MVIIVSSMHTVMEWCWCICVHAMPVCDIFFQGCVKLFDSFKAEQLSAEDSKYDFM